MPRHEELTDGPDVSTDIDEGGAAFVEHDPTASAARAAALNAELDREIADVWEHTSLNNQELTRRVLTLQTAQDRTANYTQGLPTRDEYDALHADFLELQRLVRSLLEIRERAA